MKILFLGDVMFGRDNNFFVENPFIYIKKYISNADTIIFNLETVISSNPISDDHKIDKVFNYQSNGIQLKQLKQMASNKRLIASTANNHSLDYDVYGLTKTKAFLRNNGILFANKNPLETDDLIFLSYSDHCGCHNLPHWAKHINILDYDNTDKVLKLIRKLKEKNKLIVFSIHWGSNWLKTMPYNMVEFGKTLIDNGVDIVFGHSVHHIPPVPYEIYKNKIIIYGLGDLINDYVVDPNYNSEMALMGLIDIKKTKTNIEFIPVKREFIEKGSSIPIPVPHPYKFSIPNKK